MAKKSVLQKIRDEIAQYGQYSPSLDNMWSELDSWEEQKEILGGYSLNKLSDKQVLANLDRMLSTTEESYANESDLACPYCRSGDISTDKYDSFKCNNCDTPFDIPYEEPEDDPYTESYANEDLDLEKKDCQLCNFTVVWKKGDDWQKEDAEREFKEHQNNKHGIFESYASERSYDWYAEDYNALGEVKQYFHKGIWYSHDDLLEYGAE
jgi:hypothetical protein